MRVCLVTSRVPPLPCGVGDYTLRLASTLVESDDVVVVTGVQSEVADCAGVRVLPVVPDWGPRGMLVLLKALRQLDADWVVVEYVPFLYSRIGINFSLPLAVCCLRLAGVRVLLTVHEPFVLIDSLKHAMMGICQRLMLWLLMRGSTKVALTADRWKGLVWPFAGRRQMFCAPVASSFPVVAISDSERARLRAGLGIAESDVVVATLRPAGVGKLWDQTLSVWNRLRNRHPHARLLVIGESEPNQKSAMEMNGVIDAGYVSPEQASRLLSCADVFVALFVDGVSTRRTSVMAAMAHGLPVITTQTGFSETIFAASPISRRTPNDEDGLLFDLEELVRLPHLRRERGDAGREFYARYFDWPVVAAKFCGEFRDASTPS